MIPTAARVPLSDLKPGIQPRPPEQAKAQAAFLAALFRRGAVQLVPIIAMEDGTIVDGHCRAEALKLAGKTDARVIRWHRKSPPTEEQIREINAGQSHVASGPQQLATWATLIREDGWTVERIAAALGRSTRVVAEQLRDWGALTPEEQAAAPTVAAVSAKAQAKREAQRAAKAGTVDAKGRTRKGTRGGGGKRPTLSSSQGGCELESTPTQPDPRDATIADLRQQVEALREEVAEARAALASAKSRVRELERALRSAAEG